MAVNLEHHIVTLSCNGGNLTLPSTSTLRRRILNVNISTVLLGGYGVGWGLFGGIILGGTEGWYDSWHLDQGMLCVAACSVGVMERVQQQQIS